MKSREYTLNLKLSCEPRVAVRVVLPSDDKATIKSKKQKQFINKKMCFLTVFVNDKEQYVITAHKGYCFDSASIPFGIGKGDTRLFVPALFHDIMCDNKDCIGRNRHLSSLIFRELLIMCDVPKWKADIMYWSVDNYQRFMKGWGK